MNTDQLELFQNENDYEKAMFLRAKKIKELVQLLYKDIDKSTKAKRSNLSNYAIIRIQVFIDQIRDENAPEYSSPKMFIWKFVPEVILEIDNKVEILLEKGHSKGELIGPKIIPKWANELFTNYSFSHGDFLRFTTQYFALETAIKVLTSGAFDPQIDKLNNKELIIFFERKLFPNSTFKSKTVDEYEIINRIGNLFTKLKNLQRNNCYFVGEYDDFTKENDLLLDLDSNPIFLNTKNTNKDLNSVESLLKIYNNDFLFLNNSELYSSKNYNTHTWENNYVFSPKVLDNQFKRFDEKALHKIEDENDISRLFYYYHRKAVGEIFFRTEILLPNKTIDVKQLLDLITIIRGLRNEK